VALVLAWAYELKPDGDSEAPTRPPTGTLDPSTDGSTGFPPRADPAPPPRRASTGDTDRGTSIVVLPFDNLSPDPENAFFADGLTEELIADLSRLRTLRVISRTSAYSLRGSGKDVPTIAKELNVRYVLEGSVRRAGAGLRITAQLIDASTDTHLWAEKYSGTLDQVFDLEEQLSRRIVEGMKVQLTEDEDRHLSARPIPDVRAYEHYLRARPNILAFDATSVHQALRDLEAGLEILGENVHLLKGLGMALFQLLNSGLSEDPGVLERIEECAERIRRIAPDDAAAFMVTALGRITVPDFPGAVHQLREAYRRDPTDTDTMLWLGVHSLSTGQLDVAKALIHRFHELDPLAPLSSLLVGYLAFFQGRFSESARSLEESLRLGPHVLVSLWCGVRTYIAAGEPDRAAACAQTLRDREPESPFTEAAGLLLGGLDGKKESMPEPSPALRTWASRDGEWAQYLSDAYAFGGDEEKALEWLEVARKAGFYNHVYLTTHDPFVADLRETPGWAAVLDRVRTSHRDFEESLEPLPLEP